MNAKSIGLPILFVICIGMSCLQAQTRASEKGMRYVIEDTKRGLKIEYNGKITLSSDDRSIKAISDGGFFRIEKITFGNSRELLIDSRGNSLSYLYKEGGWIKPFEPEGKAWFSDILPELVKTTPIAAEHRVERLLNKGGVKAVMEALPELKDENVRQEREGYGDSTKTGLYNIKHRLRLLNEQEPRFYKKDGYFYAEVPLIESE